MLKWWTLAENENDDIGTRRLKANMFHRNWTSLCALIFGGAAASYLSNDSKVALVVMLFAATNWIVSMIAHLGYERRTDMIVLTNLLRKVAKC